MPVQKEKAFQNKKAIFYWFCRMIGVDRDTVVSQIHISEQSFTMQDDKLYQIFKSVNMNVWKQF